MPSRISKGGLQDRSPCERLRQIRSGPSTPARRRSRWISTRIPRSRARLASLQRGRYGNYADDRPFDGTGRGGTWPLLTGERGHYELAAGNDAKPFIHAMEHFADATGLIPEQLWDVPDLPAAHLQFGYPSGAAMPLAWAHAEYVKLVRSATDGKVFDLIPEVAARYLQPHAKSTLEVWNFYRQIDAVSRSSTLRVLLGWPFRLHCGRAGLSPS